MKTIGIVGGTTWYSTSGYYNYINQMIQEHLGGNNSAKIILVSLNYEEVRNFIVADDWKSVSEIVCAAAKRIEIAGADCILIAANTLHYIAEDVEKAVSIPVIHIAKETAKEIMEMGIDSIALLGTKHTMQLSFFIDILSEYGITTHIPSEAGVHILHEAITDELGKGIFLDPTKKSIIEIIDKLAGQGADGVVLGCTEIPLLIKPTDSPLPLFDTTRIHARAAVNFALGIDKESSK